MFAIRDGNWKLVMGNEAGGQSDTGQDTPVVRPSELYDLSENPAETANVLDAHPAEVTRLDALLDEIRSSERAEGRLRRDPRLASLTLSGIDYGTFGSGVTGYAVDVAESTTTTTVTATPEVADAAVTITPADADGEADGHQVTLAAGANAITVSVLAADGETTMSYTIDVTRIVPPLTARFAALPAGHTGSAFTVRVEFSESVSTSYRTLRDRSFAVTNGAVLSARRVDGRSDQWELGIAPASNADVTVELPTTTDCAAEGAVCTWTGKPLSNRLQASVPGPTPTASVAAVTTRVTEGTPATFTVTLSQAPTAARVVLLTVGQSGTVLAGELPASVTVAAGTTHSTLAVGTDDDRVVEADGAVTVTLVAGDGYELGAAVATVVVADDDEGLLPTPTAAGAPQVGSTLEAVLEGVATDPAALRYAWLRDGAAVAGASGATYELTSADAGAVLAVRVERGAATRTSAATVPIWPVPGNPALVANEEELLGTVLTLASTNAYPLHLAGYGRFTLASFGSVNNATLEMDGAAHELIGAGVNSVGQFFLLVTPDLSHAAVVTAYWNGNRIGPLEAEKSSEGPVWTALTPQPSAEYARYWNGASDGVLVALSIRRPAPAPTVTVTALSETVAEGASASFEVTLSRATGGALTVSLEVLEEGAVLSGSAPPAVTIPAGEARATLELATEDDAVVEDSGSLTVTLVAGEHYEVGAPSTATLAVEDDDEATFTVTGDPAEIVEGGSATVTVAIDNGTTFAEEREITLSVSGGVGETDYTLDPASLTLAAGSSSVSASFAATEDEEDEERETARVAALLDGVEVGAAEMAIRLPSTDATLSGLELTDAEIGEFDSETTAYAAEVAYEVDATTVEATPGDAGASVEIVDAVGSTLGARRTTRLAEGENEIAATVTAEDGETTRTYTVTVTRESTPAWGTRRPDRDIALAGMMEPAGVWSDGTTLWASDYVGGRLRAFDLATGGRRGSRDINASAAVVPSALWSDQSTLWVADHLGSVRGYRLLDGARLADADLDQALSAAGNDAPAGLWSDGGTLRVVDLSDGRVYAYGADGARAEEYEFELRTGDVGTGWWWGLWSDGETVLTSWYGRGRLLAYRLSNGSRLPDRDIDAGAAGNDDPRDLWSDGETLWVVDGVDAKLYAYAAPGLRGLASQSSAASQASRAAPVPSAVPGPAVVLPDAALRGRIEAALGKAPGEAIGTREMAALEVLNARGAGVLDLAGLEHAVNLESLDLGLNQVEDIRPLEALVKLTRLNLDGTAVDAWSVGALAGLERLSLRNCGLAELVGLAALAQLVELDVGGNRIADLWPLAGLARLRTLHADGNRVADVTPLARLGALMEVNLRGNPVAGVDVNRKLHDSDN